MSEARLPDGPHEFGQVSQLLWASDLSSPLESPLFCPFSSVSGSPGPGSSSAFGVTLSMSRNHSLLPSESPALHRAWHAGATTVGVDGGWHLCRGLGK